MQARFPFFRQKTASNARPESRGQILGDGRGHAARSRLDGTRIRCRRRSNAQNGPSCVICAHGRVNGRIAPFRASEGVFRRIDRHGQARGEKERVRRRVSGGRGLVVRFRTDWRIRRSRSSRSRHRDRGGSSCPGCLRSSSRANRWRTDGRGGRPSCLHRNRRRPR